jgi:hypothetical protein
MSADCGAFVAIERLAAKFQAAQIVKRQLWHLRRVLFAYPEEICSIHDA